MSKDKAPSSVSATPETKIITPKLGLVGVKKEKVPIEKKEHSKLPQPTGWRLLVLPFKMGEKTKGGIIHTETTLERQQVASTCGLVLAMGSQCYDKEKDWVIFARYAGSRIQIDGGEVRLLNDDEVLATIENPEEIYHQY
jgi:chaperonin GroES